MINNTERLHAEIIRMSYYWVHITAQTEVIQQVRMSPVTRKIDIKVDTQHDMTVSITINQIVNSCQL